MWFRSIILFMVLYFSYLGFCRAQDLILTQSGDTLEVSIIEKTPSVIKYRLYQNSDDDVVVMNISEISWIRFKSGTEETFNVKVVELEEMPNDSIDRKNQVQHIGAVNPLLIFFGVIKLRYEYVPAKGNTTIEVPINMAFANKTYQLGVDFNIYFLKSPPGKYKLGPYTIGWGQTKFFVAPSLLMQQSPNAFSVMPRVKPGGTFQMQKGLNFTFSLSLGALVPIAKYEPDAKVEFSWSLNGSVGWRLYAKEKKTYKKGSIY